MTAQPPAPPSGPIIYTPTELVEDDYVLHRRFDRMGRLVGDTGMSTLFDAHVVVIGLGGVGGFAAESIVRSGVGRVTLVDFDLICVTNTNRQLQALKRLVGQPKSRVLAERMRNINPQAEIVELATFYNAETCDQILGSAEYQTRESQAVGPDLVPDLVIDAIDNFTAKCHLLATCRARGIPVVSSQGAGGRWDPTEIRVADLADTRIDPMSQRVRKILRQEHDFPRHGKFGIPAVFSVERPADPVELHYDKGEGFRCVCPHGGNDQHSCDRRRVIYGTASFVTGSFGLTCAGVAVKMLLGMPAYHGHHATHE